MLLALALTVAVVAAARSTWSPCGLSMLSTITPLAERGRDHRYGATAAWFVLGAVVGGATLGLGAALLAAGVGALGLSTGVLLTIGAVAALVGATSDFQPFGRHLPIHRRQVNEDWLSQFRPWVYGSGFGWQIGSGLSTYIVTAAVYLTIVLAALTGEPVAAFAVVLAFGFVRGLAVLLSARITTPDRLMAFHRRFDRLGETTRQYVIGFQLVVAAGALGAIWAPAPALAGTGIAAVVLAAALALSRHRAVRPAPAVAALATVSGSSPGR